MPDAKLPIPPAVASPDLADDVYRTSALGFFIHGEETKTQVIRTKDGKPAVGYTKNSDGLFSVTLTMPDGKTEDWKQTDLMMDAKTGVKVMAYERRNPDGSVYLGQDGKPQALIQSVGTIDTNQDIDANNKLVRGQSNPALFNQATAYTKEWYQNAQQRSAKEGVPMPDVLVGAHSMGAYTVGAVTLQLHAEGITPKRTIEIEPVGAGAGLQYLAAHASANPTPAQSWNTASLLSQNVFSFRSAGTADLPGSVFQLPGGREQHANSMVGQTYEYNGTSGAASLMTNHMLSLPANDLNRQGPAALRRTPGNDTSISAFLKDAPLSWEKQDVADGLLDAFDKFTLVSRGNTPGDINTTPTDLHAAPDIDPHSQNTANHKPRNYQAIKVAVAGAAAVAKETPKQSPPAPTTGVKAGSKPVKPAAAVAPRFSVP